MSQTNADNESTLTSAVLLDDLTPEPRQQVLQELAQLPAVHFAAGEKIIHEGFPALGVYLIEQGRVKTALRQAGGRTLIIKIVGAGGIVGDESVLGDSVFDYFSETMTPVVARFFKQSRFQRLVQQHPQIRHSVNHRMMREIKSLHRRLLESSFCSSKDKLAGAISDLAQTYGEPNAQGQLCLRLKRRDLAELAGVSVEMVLRTLKEFEQQRWIAVKGNTITLLSSKLS